MRLLWATSYTAGDLEVNHGRAAILEALDLVGFDHPGHVREAEITAMVPQL